jgi:DNA modification methylase
MPTLDWIGKQAVVGHHRRVPYRLLHCDRDRSAGDPDAGNLLVQGDNLEALKALLPYYAGQVKCIYIDPPYNTGNEGWVYNDNVNSPEIRRWLGEVVGGEAEDLSRHDKWLCMVYPRLAMLKQFLRDDGVIFVSIDDNEVEHLGLVMDEIFGRTNRVGTIIWKNATDNNPTRIVPEHEYVLCYARNLAATAAVWKAQTLDVKQRLIDIGDELISRHGDDIELQSAYTKWFQANKVHLWPFDRYKFIDRGGVFTGSQSVHNPGKEGYRYDVPHPETGKPCRQPMMGYRYPPESMKRLLDEKRIIFGEDEDKIIEIKVYVRDYQAKLSSVFDLDGRKGTNEIKELFPESKRPFNFPKPTGLIEELLAFTTSGDDLILDSFAGSGTTGQAVLQLNAADSGRRRFVLVEVDEDIGTKITAERTLRPSVSTTRSAYVTPRRTK